MAVIDPATAEVFALAPTSAARNLAAALLAKLTWRNGRRVRLRTVWGNPWRFDSSREQFRASVAKIRVGSTGALQCVKPRPIQS